MLQRFGGLARALARQARLAFHAALVAASLLMWLAFAANWHALWAAGLRPTMHGFTSVSYTILAWSGLHLVLLTAMAGYTLVRSGKRLLDSVRRNTFDNTRISGR